MSERDGDREGQTECVVAREGGGSERERIWVSSSTARRGGSMAAW